MEPHDSHHLIEEHLNDFSSLPSYVSAFNNKREAKLRIFDFLEDLIKRIDEIALQKDIKEMEGIMKSIIDEKGRVFDMKSKLQIRE